MATVRRLGLFYNCPLFNPASSEGYFNFFQGCAAPLKETVEFIWRVKRWNFQATLNPNWITVESTYRDNLNEHEFGGPVLTNEKSLVCNSLIFTHYFGADRLDEDGAVVDTSYYLYAPELALGTAWPSNLYSPLHFFVSGLVPDAMNRTGVLTYQIDLAGQLYSEPAGFVSMSPQEYWPYDPEDGAGPIYDSGTGAQLREFPD